MAEDANVNKKKPKSMLQTSMQNSGSSGFRARNERIRYLGSHHMHKVVSEKKFRQKSKSTLPGDCFGKILRASSNIELNDLKQRKENDVYFNLPDDAPFPKHVT